MDNCFLCRFAGPGKLCFNCRKKQVAAEQVAAAQVAAEQEAAREAAAERAVAEKNAAAKAAKQALKDAPQRIAAERGAAQLAKFAIESIEDVSADWPDNTPALLSHKHYHLGRSLEAFLQQVAREKQLAAQVEIYPGAIPERHTNPAAQTSFPGIRGLKSYCVTNSTIAGVPWEPLFEFVEDDAANPQSLSIPEGIDPTVWLFKSTPSEWGLHSVQKPVLRLYRISDTIHIGSITAVAEALQVKYGPPGWDPEDATCVNSMLCRNSFEWFFSGPGNEEADITLSTKTGELEFRYWGSAEKEVLPRRASKYILLHKAASAAHNVMDL